MAKKRVSSSAIIRRILEKRPDLPTRDVWRRLQREGRSVNRSLISQVRRRWKLDQTAADAVPDRPPTKMVSGVKRPKGANGQVEPQQPEPHKRETSPAEQDYFVEIKYGPVFGEGMATLLTPKISSRQLRDILGGLLLTSVQREQ
jgi:transposase InsO family protein